MKKFEVDGSMSNCVFVQLRIKLKTIYDVVNAIVLQEIYLDFNLPAEILVVFSRLMSKNPKISENKSIKISCHKKYGALASHYDL